MVAGEGHVLHYNYDSLKTYMKTEIWTYRSRLGSDILHKDTSKELQRQTPAAKQHVVGDHHPHETTVGSGETEERRKGFFVYSYFDLSKKQHKNKEHCRLP